MSDLDAWLDADSLEPECIQRLLSALREPSSSTPPESERTSRRLESAFARTMKVPVLNPLQGQTTPVGDDSIEKVVSALPYPGNTAGPAIVPFPRLTLEQYASLCAELRHGRRRGPHG